nr:hypothetical protein [Tanacetum cinerariifolium]
MMRVGKGFSGVDTPLFARMLVPQQTQEVEDDAEDEDDVNEVSDEPTPPSPTPATPPPPPQQEHIPSPPQAATAPSSPPPQSQHSQTAAIFMNLLNTLLETCATLTKKETDEAEPTKGRLEESQAKVYHLDLEHADKVLCMQETDEAEPTKVEEVKSKDKGKGIIVEEPKPLKRQAQIEQDEAFAKELEAELNANIN